jgi:cell division protein FtsB
MSRKSGTIVSILTASLAVIFFSIFFAEKGFLDLLRLKEQKHAWEVANSRIGLKLLASIRQYKRLVDNDPDLINQLAREQGMVGKDELVLIPKVPIHRTQQDETDSEADDNFRFLKGKEFEYLHRFKDRHFKFYDELIEND